MLFEEFAWQLVDDLRIRDLGGLGHERQAVAVGQHHHDLLLAHEVELDKHLAEELLVAAFRLVEQRLLQLLDGEQPLLDKRFTKTQPGPCVHVRRRTSALE